MFVAGCRAAGVALVRNSDFSRRDENGNKIRTVLHCDANAFFASVETVLEPKYASVPMAVCGSQEDRHGIVLAKNELAKKFKIKTGETIWQAKRKCPSLTVVRPTYGVYADFSRRMNRIFGDYTDLVEPFGIDESWLDVTGSQSLFGDGKTIADDIRKRVHEELGITVSVGVSFNKVFAKLGSDMKKPDATTVIPYDGFASVIWKLPVSDLLFVGPSCSERLSRVGIFSIGDLACADAEFIARYLGKSGIMLRDFALGRDFSPVSREENDPEPKSVSNGMTFRYNLSTKEDVSFAVNYLSRSVAERLRRHGLCCRTVAVTVRTTDQASVIRQAPAPRLTCLSSDIAAAALALIRDNFDEECELYSVTVHAENLARNEGNDLQQFMFPTRSQLEYLKRQSLECAIDRIKERFGAGALTIGSAINNRLI